MHQPVFRKKPAPTEPRTAPQLDGKLLQTVSPHVQTGQLSQAAQTRRQRSQRVIRDVQVAKFYAASKQLFGKAFEPVSAEVQLAKQRQSADLRRKLFQKVPGQQEASQFT